MIERSLQNVPASIHQRLLNIAKETGRPFSELLQYFAMERFLFRLSRSTHAPSFVLKGALLFRVWDTPDSRATRDIDFLAYVDNSPENIASIISEICTITDVDVGFGDLIHPGAIQVEYPSLLDLATPLLRSYTPETVIAEKSQAMVHLGSLNSRMKDFYDIWRMSRQFDFQGGTLQEAMQRTFNYRDTEFVAFEDLTQELLESKDIKMQWLAFRRKVPVEAPDSFADIIEAISNFLAPVFATTIGGQTFEKCWKAPGPWIDD